jgi:hypothetical protein
VRDAAPIAEALLAAKERTRLQRQDEASSSAVGGSDSAVTASGSSYRAAQRNRREDGPKHYSNNSALGVDTQPTIFATAAQKTAAPSSVHHGDDESVRSGEGGARRRSSTSLRERSLSSDGHPSRHETPEATRDSVDDRGGGRVVAEQPKLGAIADLRLAAFGGSPAWSPEQRRSHRGGGGKSLLPRV